VHSPAIGLAGRVTIGIVIAGPFWFMGWLSLVRCTWEDETEDKGLLIALACRQFIAVRCATER